jgi:adenylate cyclase
MHKAALVEHWLIDGARSATRPEDVLQQMCDRLVACNVPLSRGAVFVETLHPMVMGRSFTWQPGSSVEIRQAPIGFKLSDVYRTSPVAAVAATGKAIRRRLIDMSCPRDFPILEELVAAGVTDYLAVPLRFSNGEIHATSFATASAPTMSKRLNGLPYR